MGGFEKSVLLEGDPVVGKLWGKPELVIGELSWYGGSGEFTVKDDRGHLWSCEGEPLLVQEVLKQMVASEEPMPADESDAPPETPALDVDELPHGWPDFAGDFWKNLPGWVRHDYVRRLTHVREMTGVNLELVPRLEDEPAAVNEVPKAAGSNEPPAPAESYDYDEVVREIAESAAAWARPIDFDAKGLRSSAKTIRAMTRLLLAFSEFDDAYRNHNQGEDAP